MERIRQRDPLAAAALSRLGFALVVSAAAHAAVLSRFESAPPRPVAQSVVQARIVSPPLQPVPKPVTIAKTRLRTVLPAPADESPVPVPQREPALEAQPARAEAAAIGVPIDLNYYSARELDIYPLPLQRIETEAPPQAVGQEGRVQVLALIDETGRVTDAEIFDAEPARLFDLTAIDAIRRTRFVPARKEGRQVRSRVLIELTFSAQR